jgi:hypothetical protein
MKKILFPGIAALLMLAVFSCEVEEQSGGGITLNGPESSGGRALDGPIAEALTNFYEATFQRISDNKIIRTTWNYAQKGRIQIEPGVYKIILLAGRSAVDKTLLGVGQATGIGGGGLISTVNPLQVTIEASTTDLYFHAYSLMNDINGGETVQHSGTVDTASTFETALYPAAYPTQYIEDGFQNDIPVFKIKRDDTTEATWKFGIGALPGVTPAPSVPANGKHGYPGSGDQIDVFGSSLLVADLPYVPCVYQDVFHTDPSSPVNPVKLKAVSFKNLNADDKITGSFDMSFTAPDNTNMVQISLDVPVVAIANSDKPVIWHIRGGLNNELIDAGVNSAQRAGATGGAIVLEF